MAIKRRVVVTGLGSIGLRHARLLREREDLITEVLEPHADTAAKAQLQLGDITLHTDFDEMLDTQPDIIWLATPTTLHAQQSLKALTKGIHVFCEKPMTATLQEAKQVQQLVEKTGMVFNVGFHLHFGEGIRLLKELIDSGKLGNILHLYARVGTHITLVNSLTRYQATHPGSLFFDYAHQMDLIYWLLQQKPRSVFAPGFQGGTLPFSSAPNVADIFFEYDTDLQAHVHLNYVQMPQRHCYEVTGEQAWATLDYEEGCLQIGYRATQAIETIRFQQERDDIYRLEHEAFLEAVAGNRPVETSAADGLVSTALSESVLSSWKTNSKVEVLY